MKKYLAALLITIGSAAAAQQAAPVEITELNFKAFCSNNGRDLLVDVMNQYGEKALFTGASISTIVSLDGMAELDLKGMLAVTVNQNTQSFGVFMIYPDGSACEIASGTEFEPYVE